MKASALILAAVLGALVSAPSAHAGGRVFLSIGGGGGCAPRIYAPPVCYRPVPVVYCPPRVVYFQPAPVYYAPAPVYYAPASVVCAPAPVAYRAPIVSAGISIGGPRFGWR